MTREHVVARVLLAGHEQPKLPHAFSAGARERLALRDLPAPGAIAVLLEELLLAAKALLLEALDDVDGGADVHVIPAGTWRAHPVAESEWESPRPSPWARASELVEAIGGQRAAWESAREAWGRESRVAWEAENGVVGILHGSVDPGVIVAVRSSGVDILVILFLKVRSREAGVNVLRNDAELLVSAGGEAGEVGILNRAIFVQRAADEVGAVGQVWSLDLRSDGTGLGSATAASRANGGIRSIGDGKLGLGGVILANPVILASHTTGKLVELRGVLDELRG
ncbi:hypothetical protein CCMA1212_008862 [Trichoderma ghanense]|uniref:Uncharacterized protein n=1 Tax=Trichoderma ghanense TaxID=65468 RepID=A0ABY2GVU3_9HYPO